jgi:hypothetical protein
MIFRYNKHVSKKEEFHDSSYMLDWLTKLILFWSGEKKNMMIVNWNFFKKIWPKTWGKKILFPRAEKWWYLMFS